MDVLLCLFVGEQKFRRARLQVTSPEPMHADNPLLTLPNVCVLPHIGSATQQTPDAMALLVAKNIIAGLKGEKMPTLINKELTIII